MKLAIYGYGNLGRGVELAAKKNKNVSLTGIFTRRQPSRIHSSTAAAVFAAEDLTRFADDIDVVAVCGGSATDLPEMTPVLAEKFNVIDSFDTHAAIPGHFAAVDAAARAGGHAAMISVGWDPGLFSLSRLFGDAFLPDGRSYTFWGKGVSQGHSDAIRRIEGVKDARQYTVPVDGVLEKIRNGQTPDLTPEQMHTRQCYVVTAPGADKTRIEKKIRSMPDYFEGYETFVNFISGEEMETQHSGLPHGGTVIRTGKTGNGNRHTVSFSLSLDSNPEFTGSVIVAYAEALYRMYTEGIRGCKTVFDVPPSYLIGLDENELRKRFL